MAQSKMAIISRSPLLFPTDNIARSSMTTKFGQLFLESSSQGLTKCHLGGNSIGNNLNHNKNSNSFSLKIIKEAKKQLKIYFKNPQIKFDLPLDFSGTDFQLKVWKTLKRVSSGKTISYQDLAIKIGLDNGQRAIGGAVNKNPLMIFIPCHRVIQKNGSIGGFAVSVSIKEALLFHECRRFFL